MKKLPLGPWSQGGVVILSFHDIQPEYYDWFYGLISALRKRYAIEEPSILWNGNSQLSSGEIRLIISFDDGYQSTAELSDYLKHTYNIKCLIFICTGFIGLNKAEAKKFYLENMLKSQPVGTFNIQPMQWEDIIRLSRDGHEIGAHTVNHKTLSNLNFEQMTAEILGSRTELASKLSTAPRCFAYPFGNLQAISHEVIKVAHRYFEFCFTNIRGSLSKSPHQSIILRQNVNIGEAVSDVQGTIDGKFNVLSLFSRLRLQYIAFLLKN